MVAEFISSGVGSPSGVVHPPAGVDPTTGGDPTPVAPTTPPGGSQDAADSLNTSGVELYAYLYQNYDGSSTLHEVDGNSQQSVVVGSSGADFVVGVAGNQELIGGGGNDCLLGGAGHITQLASSDSAHQSAGVDTANNWNVLVGGPSDTLIGGQGADFFIFGAHCGQNVIQNFDVQTDTFVIDSASTGITSFAQLQSHISDSAQGTVVDLGHGDAVLLAGVHPSQLITSNVNDFTQSDFWFINPSTLSSSSHHS